MLGNPEMFSLQVTISTLKHGYDLLLSATNATEPSIIRVFGIAMQRRSREQLLLHLRWLLGPGILELGRLCKATFYSSDAAVLCNADEVANLVQQGSIRSIGNDVIELSTDSRNVVGSVGVKPLGTGPGSFHSLSKEGNSWKESNNHQGTTQTIRISMSLLLRNLAHAGFCLITGPAFTMQHLEKAINASVI
ncbi:uncharacterized protein BKA55DRAFT_537506 [Fusarium redolens]|uniref:Uncharacterized protein n=1 Tax=Fusarium redolens TaxID=48865 RepID=A0A9P9HCQ3_FUSRE|nr:uncharacterized protein BKA55DRAFT_537506 [Fusarium redolens]KAH7255091.1 hypothetical protein BKA55DRAFT_537506 [Fusarium redolens]